MDLNVWPNIWFAMPLGLCHEHEQHKALPPDSTVDDMFTAYDTRIPQLNELFAKYTGKTVEEIEMETDREKFLGPEQAVELGIVDGIIGEVSGVSKMVEETIKDFKENSAWRGAGTKT